MKKHSPSRQPPCLPAEPVCLLCNSHFCRGCPLRNVSRDLPSGDFFFFWSVCFVLVCFGLFARVPQCSSLSRKKKRKKNFSILNKKCQLQERGLSNGYAWKPGTAELARTNSLLLSWQKHGRVHLGEIIYANVPARCYPPRAVSRRQ